MADEKTDTKLEEDEKIEHAGSGNGYRCKSDEKLECRRSEKSEEPHPKIQLNGHGCPFYRMLSTRKVAAQNFDSMFEFIKNVAEELGSEQCFYTIDFADILWKVQLWRRQLSDIRPYYAVKANSDPMLLRLLVLLGHSFDCASQGEIRMVLEAGGSPRNIIFAHVIKTPGALRYAQSVGVELMTFDSQEELRKIKKYYPTARLLLRLNPEDVKCTFDLSEKFGCEMEDVWDILSQAKELNMDVVGVSFHVGGLCTRPSSYTATVRASREVFSMAEELGFEFNILDIGGGFTGEKDSEDLFIEMSETLKSALKEHFPGDDVQLIAEPGTFIVGSSATLTTAICGKKKFNQKVISRDEPKYSIERFYYINDSIYGSFFVDYSSYGVRPIPLLEESELLTRPVCNSTLWGQTCCGLDIVLKECRLPDMEEEEFLVWQNIGSYARALCSRFCGVPLPDTRYVFINNDRLDLEWLPDDQQIADLISNTCSLIDQDWQCQ